MSLQRTCASVRVLAAIAIQFQLIVTMTLAVLCPPRSVSHLVGAISVCRSLRLPFSLCSADQLQPCPMRAPPPLPLRPLPRTSSLAGTDTLRPTSATKRSKEQRIPHRSRDSIVTRSNPCSDS